jgi:hypothetical protein
LEYFFERTSKTQAAITAADTQLASALKPPTVCGEPKFREGGSSSSFGMHSFVALEFEI